MPLVEGRGRKEPCVSTGFTGRGVLIRIDDNAVPEFWLAVEFTIDELRQMIDQFEAWQMRDSSDFKVPDDWPHGP